MFIGHFALGFGAKRAAPAVSLGTLFLACQLADPLWPTLVLLGIEVVRVQPGDTAVTPLTFVSYPYSHSLVALLGWDRLGRGSDVAAGDLGLLGGPAPAGAETRVTSLTTTQRSPFAIIMDRASSIRSYRRIDR